jgi:small subunit ribosomal protein S11
MKEKLEKGIIKQNFPIYRLDTKRFAKSFFYVLTNSFTPEGHYNSLIHKRVGCIPPLGKNYCFLSSLRLRSNVVRIFERSFHQSIISKIDGVGKNNEIIEVPTSRAKHTKEGTPSFGRKNMLLISSKRIVKDIKTKICKHKEIKKVYNSNIKTMTPKGNVRRLVSNKKFKKLSLSELKKRGKIGFIYLTCTKNNTICTLVDPKGNTKGWNSSGTLGFKNARKSTIYAAQGAAEMIAIKAKNLGFKRACLIIKGLGRGKESSVRILRKSGLKILSVEEKTPIPHNGCRPPKKRRV